jgi:hypothetical protein
MTGLATVDAAIDSTRKAGNNHTLAKQDINNFRAARSASLTKSTTGLFCARLRTFLRPTERGVYQHGYLELSVSERSRNHFAGRQRADCQRINNTSTTIPLSQWLPFRVLYPSARRRQLYNPRQHADFL